MPSEPFPFTPVRSSEIIGDLIDTRVAHKAAGLSAVQIGIHLRVVAFDPIRFFGFIVIMNPEIVERGKDLVLEPEGCMSIGMGVPRYNVRRHRVVTVKFLDRRGVERTAVAKGFAARLIQHEIDHMDGKLIA